MLNDFTLSFFNSSIKFFLIEVQVRFVHVADLAQLVHHPCDLPCRKRAFFSFCACSSSMKTLLFESPFMIFLRPLVILESRTSKFVCNFAQVIVCHFFRPGTAFADSISLIHTIASIGRLAHEEYFTPEIHSPDPGIFDNRPGSELKCFGILFLGRGISL